MPIGVNAKCFSMSPTLISFPVALWPLQLWSDEVEKVSIQLKLCSNLLGVLAVFRGAGVLWTPSCWCACTHAGEDQWDVAVVSPGPDPAALWFSVTLTAAWEEPASWASWLYLV